MLEKGIYFYRKKSKAGKLKYPYFEYGDILELLECSNSPSYQFFSQRIQSVVNVEKTIDIEKIICRVCDKLEVGDIIQHVSTNHTYKLSHSDNRYFVMEVQNSNSPQRTVPVTKTVLYTDIYKKDTIVISNNVIETIQKFKRGKIYIEDKHEVLYLEGWNDMKTRFTVIRGGKRVDWTYSEMESLILREEIKEVPPLIIGTTFMIIGAIGDYKIVKIDDPFILMNDPGMPSITIIDFLNKVKKGEFKIMHIPVNVNISVNVKMVGDKPVFRSAKPIQTQSILDELKERMLSKVPGISSGPIHIHGLGSMDHFSKDVEIKWHGSTEKRTIKEWKELLSSPDHKDDLTDAFNLAHSTGMFPIDVSKEPWKKHIISHDPASGKTVVFNTSKSVENNLGEMSRRGCGRSASFAVLDDPDEDLPNEPIGISVITENVKIEEKQNKSKESWECVFKLPSFTEKEIVRKPQIEKLEENISNKVN